MSNFHNVKLSRARDSEGKSLSGLWVSDIVLLEAVSGGWECQVPLRKIGKSNYFEFRPVSMGGKFLILGTFRTRDSGCVLAERLQSGTHVVRGPYQLSFGASPMLVISWSEVSEEIARTA